MDITVPELIEARVCGLGPSDFGLGGCLDVIGEPVMVGEAATGLIVLWNDPAARLFGYTAAEAIGMPIEALVPASSRARCRKGRTSYARTGLGGMVGNGRAREVLARTKSGEKLCVALTLSPIDDVRSPGRFLLAIVRDVSDRWRAEVQRDEANNSWRELVLTAAGDLTSSAQAIKTAGAYLSSAGDLSAAEITTLGTTILRQADQVIRLLDDLVERSRPGPS